MNRVRSVRDVALLDALEAVAAKPFAGSVWRVVREGRDPCQCAASGGRWDDRTFDVLYTAGQADGAISEILYHLTRGQPIFPSKVRYKLFELSVSIKRVLAFEALQDLAKVGLDTTSYGQLSHSERAKEYPRSQEVAEAAHFLGNQGLLVPNARWNCLNLVIFCDEVAPEDVEVKEDYGLVDWTSWKNNPLGY